MKKIEYLQSELENVAKLGSALGLLGWDKEVNLPPKAHHFRGEVTAMLAGELHTRFTSDKFIQTVKELAEPSNFKRLSPDQQIIVRETWRDVKRAQKLPLEFVKDFAKLTTEAFSAWVDARKVSDFKKFEPTLKRIIDMKRQEAELVGYKRSPYDALVDEFEPEMTSQELDKLFTPLAKSLSELVETVANKPLPKLAKMKYPQYKQEKLNSQIAKSLGYDFEAGRLDVSPHPFTASFHPTDVRITTRYNPGDFWVALGATIHEVGHALYEQGLPAADYGTPLGTAVSLGVHESQSRIWENFVGRSREFVHFLYPKLAGLFGELPYDEQQLYRWLNRVEPSLIRVEADEVTYNLHIILRYEIEKAVIEGSLKTKDLPVVWNQKMKDYFGIKVPDDAHGVLQDVHWAHGVFGYFPTYGLGNLYAAQLYKKAQSSMPNLTADFAAGDFKNFLAWLRKEIHVHGRRYQPEDLIERATAEPLNPQYLQNHLEQRIKI